MLLRRCSGGVATARVLQPRRRRGAVAASLAPSQQALQWPGCCSCGGVAAPSPPAPTVAAEGQGSRVASLAEASTHQHHRESAADPRQPVGCDGAATTQPRRLQHPGLQDMGALVTVGWCLGACEAAKTATWYPSFAEPQAPAPADPRPSSCHESTLINADSMEDIGSNKSILSLW